MDPDDYIRFIAALFFVLGLIAALAWIARKSGLVAGISGLGSKKNGHIEIVESKTLDARRRLVLVRCGPTAHLLLLASQGDMVIANNLDVADFDLEQASSGSDAGTMTTGTMTTRSEDHS